jgi:hypothetical protein
MNRPASLLFYPSPSLFLSLSLSLFLVLSVCVCEPRKVGKESEGGSKKRKEVGNDNSLTSIFAKHQAASALNKARDAYNAQIQKGIEMRLDEAAQAEPARRSEKGTHDSEGA